MEVKINKKSGELSVHVKESDNCYTCINKEKCPLVNALHGEVAILRYAYIDVEACDMYKKKRTRNV